MNEPATIDVFEEYLRDSSSTKALLEMIETGVYVVDRDRRILYWNPAAERIIGYLAHEVAGRLSCVGYPHALGHDV